jgi:hypothetical protein
MHSAQLHNAALEQSSTLTPASSIFLLHRISNNMRDFCLAHNPLMRRFLNLVPITIMRRPPLRISDQLHLVAPRHTTVGLTLGPGRAEGERAREVRFVAFACEVVEVCLLASP